MITNIYDIEFSFVFGGQNCECYCWPSDIYPTQVRKGIVVNSDVCEHLCGIREDGIQSSECFPIPKWDIVKQLIGLISTLCVQKGKYTKLS